MYPFIELTRTYSYYTIQIIHPLAPNIPGLDWDCCPSEFAGIFTSFTEQGLTALSWVVEFVEQEVSDSGRTSFELEHSISMA